MFDESTIINQVLAGDAQAFSCLVHRYQKPVISMSYHILNDRHIAEDIAQDVFFTAYQKLASFDPARSQFSTWLFTITRRLSFNALKKKIPIPLAELPDKPTSSNPTENFDQKEIFTRLDHILDTLPNHQKTAFILAELENLPYTEIARLENARLGTIKSRINRAKHKIAAALKTFSETNHENR
ncbi:MAG: sigma-70 family RNA polymerase sigma factor [Planctomycetes bacterium]|nr:sigma-70 family RNA polymerase sigma factor [Planctomycetota bacterium]